MSVIKYNEEKEEDIMAKMGRPKVEVPRVNKISVRLTDDEHQVLIDFANSHNMTKTEALKRGLELLYNQQEDEQ